jgi:hypothetical protein
MCWTEGFKSDVLKAIDAIFAQNGAVYRLAYMYVCVCVCVFILSGCRSPPHLSSVESYTAFGVVPIVQQQSLLGRRNRTQFHQLLRHTVLIVSCNAFHVPRCSSEKLKKRVCREMPVPDNAEHGQDVHAAVGRGGFLWTKLQQLQHIPHGGALVHCRRCRIGNKWQREGK